MAAETLVVGASGRPVAELHAYLAMLGHYSGKPQDKFDDATAAAVKALQTDYQLVPSGNFDAATALELDTHLSLLRGGLRCLGFIPDV